MFDGRRDKANQLFEINIRKSPTFTVDFICFQIQREPIKGQVPTEPDPNIIMSGLTSKVHIITVGIFDKLVSIFLISINTKQN